MNKLSLACLSALLLSPAAVAAAKSDAKVAIVLPTPKPGKGQIVFFRPAAWEARSSARCARAARWSAASAPIVIM